jgi:hypothetical protein
MRLLGEVVYPGDEPLGWIVGPQQGSWLTVTDHGAHRWILASRGRSFAGRGADDLVDPLVAQAQGLGDLPQRPTGRVRAWRRNLHCLTTEWVRY